jgi:hypothetical protein
LTEFAEKIQEPRLWRGDGWTARVIKNEDDDGWAVAMVKDGEAEPALVGPWTMGRDKKNPKPLDGNAFSTLVKTAREFVRRSEQQLHASLHQSITVTASSAGLSAVIASAARQSTSPGSPRRDAPRDDDLLVARVIRVTVCLDIVPDEDNPYAMLSARDEGDELLAEVRVAPSFKLSRSSAVAWAEGGFVRPASSQ